MNLQKNSQKKKMPLMNSTCTRELKELRRKFYIQYTVLENKYVQTLTFSADLFIRCLEFLVNFIRRFLQFRELQAGVRIELRKSAQAEGFIARLTKTYVLSASIFLWISESK